MTRLLATETHCAHGHEWAEESTYLYAGRKFCRLCSREQSRRFKRQYPEKVRDGVLRRIYGISYEIEQQMLQDQDFKCAIAKCRRDITSRHDVDHDHETGKVRALLCHQCNKSLGLANDNPDKLRSMAEYLETHK